MVIVGDGLAGLMLASRLDNPQVWGDGRCNTPPRALVHLFAGRTFRRDELQVKAFQRAVEYWRAEPLATEHGVYRWIKSGDRLDRSLEACNVPEQFQPQRWGSEMVHYGPGFSIAARELRARWLDEVDYRQGRPVGLEGAKVLAVGGDIRNVLTWLEWDCSEGECWTCQQSPANDAILIGEGLHIAPGPNLAVIGGKPDLGLASQLAGVAYQNPEVWKGKRCANAVDRCPVLGWLDQKTFLFCSFGARGLFWLPYCTDLAVEALSNGDDSSIPPELRWDRFKP